MVGGRRGQLAAGRESVRLSAARPSAPPSASRPDAAALGSATAGRCGRPARCALPPRPRRRRPVGRSVSQSRCARRGSCGRSRRLPGRSAAPEEAAAAGAAAAHPGPLEDRVAAAVSAQPRSRGGRRGRPGADCEALPRLLPPFSRRPAPPSGRGAGGRAWGGVAAGPGPGSLDHAQRGGGG